MLALAGCGGGDSSPQLVDGSQAAEPPAELDGLDDAVLTRHEHPYRAARQAPLHGVWTATGTEHTVVVERTGLHGSSWTFADEPRCTGATRFRSKHSRDPDRPYDGIWCGSANGRIDDGRLNDPRLDLCTNTDSEITAFAWVEPRPDAKWVVVSDAGKREVYEVVESLPVRVTTTEGVDAGELEGVVRRRGVRRRRHQAHASTRSRQRSPASGSRARGLSARAL